jgi:hypothetical protein
LHFGAGALLVVWQAVREAIATTTARRANFILGGYLEDFPESGKEESLRIA